MRQPEETAALELPRPAQGVRVAIGNKEAAFPVPPPLSRGSLWGEMIILSSATASHWAPAQHVIAGVPRGPASSFLPGTGSWGEESAELCPWNHEWHSKLSATFLLVLHAKSVPWGLLSTVGSIYPVAFSS